ncbi:hypothetical protein E2C01_066531 [Portunus trituberculatus]|uniref:Uncharacterized protein n=1 Tax=Portunus trituberculatus TaxID=210409 RepID=A0A5B7HQ12_PORTR|nr:hypothetical protein [Portunus trituberculatus]
MNRTQNKKKETRTKNIDKSDYVKRLRWKEDTLENKDLARMWDWKCASSVPLVTTELLLRAARALVVLRGSLRGVTAIYKQET